jgi:DNA-binding CsgD family transcriptional regulator
MVQAVGELERGRRAYEASAWLEAFESLARADEVAPLSAGDLELLGRSAYMLGRDDDYARGLERAHALHVAAGEALPAIRCAWWIGHNMLFRGKSALAEGWFARGRRLLEGYGHECAERGYLLAPVWLEQIARGDYDAGYETATEAAALGERFGDADLVWLARDEQARALAKQGRLTEALRLVDEALVVALAGELSPIVTGIVYCNTIAFCRDAYEVRHAREWTDALTQWCERQPEMVAHNGLCLVHRAELMQLQGAWDEALREAERASERFRTGVLNELGRGGALYRQGEIRRLRGELAAADEAYRAASGCGYEPQPGLALLRLAEERAVDAVGAIRRVVGERGSPLARAEALPACVEIMLAVRDLDGARRACEELERIAAAHPNDVLRAATSYARGLVASAEEDVRAAVPALREALHAWQELGAPYESARARVGLGLACRAAGDLDTALLELRAAREVFARLGARPDLERVDVELGRVASTKPYGLSNREVEVLRLVAAGRSNREIAVQLVISEHTVARHLQNVFRKLGVSSRSAAGAFAAAHDLL